jgi:hypothetical protein
MGAAMFSFALIGLRPGQKLISVFDENETATVEDDKRIRFRGEVMALGAAAMILAREAGKRWPAIQGPMYWKLPNGQNLVEFRERLERRKFKEELELSHGEPAQLIDPKLIEALRSAAKNPAANEKASRFLTDDNQLRMFAKNIEEGRERAEFLTIPGIDGEIYENLSVRLKMISFDLKLLRADA